MDVRVGDVLLMKKAHPCGEKRWQVLRTGADFRLRCLGCGHELIMSEVFCTTARIAGKVASLCLNLRRNRDTDATDFFAPPGYTGCIPNGEASAWKFTWIWW